MSVAGTATRRRCGAALIAWSCVLIAATRGVADPPRASDGAQPATPPPPLTFRRVHVPEAQLPDVARGYLPIKRDEFQRLLDAIHERETHATIAAAQIQRAAYAARLVGTNLVDGKATLAVATRSPTEATLALEPCNLPVREPVWLNSQPKSPPPPSPRPARVGVNPQGRLVAFVDQPGDLQFSWSLRGAAKLSGELAFTLRLPACPLQRLKLELPAGVQPVVDHGNVTQQANAPVAPAAAWTTWLIELGGRGDVELRLVSGETRTSRSGAAFVRHVATYELTASHLELKADLHFDVWGDPLEHLTFDIDRDLQVTSVTAADKPLRWQSVHGDDSDQTRLEVEPPEPLAGADRALRITAVAPLPPLDEAWRLPNVAARDAIWQQAEATLHVAESLELQSLDVRDGQRIIRPAPTLAANGTNPTFRETVHLEFWGPAASVELQLTHRPPQARAAVGTTLNVDATSLQARTVVDLTGWRGNVYTWQAAVSADWTIDSVESLPPQQVEDFELSPASGATPARLDVHLRKAVNSGHGVRLVIRAQRRRPADNPWLAWSETRPLSVGDEHMAKSLVALHGDASSAAELAGDATLRRFAVADLTPRAAELLDVRPGAIVFTDDRGANRLKFRFPAAAARYAARVDVVAAALDGVLHEVYDVRVEPQASPVGRVLIHVSVARPRPWNWTIAGEREPALAARRLSDDDQRRLGFRDGETWELTFAAPRGTPFTSRAERFTTLADNLAIGLVTLPEADSQVGYLRVDADSPHVRVTGSGLTTIPMTPAAPDRFSPTIAAFRYEPAHDAAAQLTTTRGEHPPPPARAWTLDLISRQAENKTVHHAFAKLENHGAPAVTFRLPPDATLSRVLLNDRTVSATHAKLDGGEQGWEIALPDERRFLTLLIEYTTAATPLGLQGTVVARWPELDVPVLHRAWTVWLPPGIERVPENGAGDANRSVVRWTDRLFGRFLAPQTHAPFNLFSPHDWETLFGDDTLAKQTATDAETYLRVFGEQAIPLSTPPAMSAITSGTAPSNTWGEWAASCQQRATALSSNMPPLRIDAAALAELELAPNTSLAKLTLPKTEDAVRRGIAWLEHFQLALVAGPDGCWLTSAAALLSEVEQNGRVLFRNVFANESPIWESPSTPDVAHARRWLTVTDWIAAEPQPRSPWRSANHGFDAGELAGWRRVHVELIRPELATLRVYRPSVIRGWSWAMFLCVVGASGWVVRRRHSWLAPLLAIAVGVVLVVPVEWIPIGQAMFWGALLVAISNRYWRHAETPARNTAENSSSHIASRAALAGTVAGLFVGVIVLASTARSADDAAPPIAYRVLVPIDDKRQPVGDYVHLPREFYHALRERGAAAELGGDEWFVVAAEYRGSLMRAAGGDGFDISDFQMQFDLDVRRAGVRVRLPLPEAAVALQANGCRLDGEPIVVEWDRDGHQLEFVVAATGTHKLELALQPLLRPSPRDAGRTGFSFGIPRAPHGRLELRLPRDVVDVTVPSALGAIVVDRNAGTLVAELGPATELTVRWPAQSADAAPPFDVEQLCWLKIQPGSVVLETKHTLLLPPGEKPRRVTLTTDPRVRLLPLRPGQPISGHHIHDGPAPSIDFELQESDTVATTGTLQFQASFLLPKASAVGQLTVPKFNVPQGRITKRWLAVSVAPTLRGELLSETATSPLAAAAFAEAWGKVEAAPQFAVRWSAGDAPVTVATRPRDALLQIEQDADVVVGKTEARIAWSARIEASAGDVAEYRLLAPPEFQPTEISLQHDDASSPLRWFREPAGAIVIVLDRPPPAQHTLHCRGWLSVDSPTCDVPNLRLATGRVRRNGLRVFRDSDVRVEVANVANWSAVEDAAVGEFQTGAGRLVASLQMPTDADADDAPLSLRVTPNVPRLDARLVTTMIRHDGEWEAEVDYRVRIQDGVVDLLRVELPPECDDVRNFSLPVRHELVTLPGDAKRQLLVWPQQPLSGEFQLRFICSLADVTSELERVPEIVPLDVTTVERWVVVPISDEQQRFEWQTSGLRAATLPGDDAAAPRAGWQAYQVVGGGFRAWLRHVEPAAGRPLVELVDAQLFRRRDESFVGSVAFDIDPGGLAQCELLLPAGCELLGATLEGAPAELTTTAARTWRVMLGSSRLPQRLELLYSGPSLPDGYSPDMRRLPIPRLRDLAVERTLWCVWDDGSAEGTGRAGQPGQPAVAPHHELDRLRAEAALIHLAAESLGDVLPQDFQHWYLPRARRFWSAHARLRDELQAHPVAAEQEELDALVADQTAFAERRKLQPLFEQAKQESAALAPPNWERLDANAPRRLAAGTEAAAMDNVAVEIPSPPPSDFLSRLALALGFAAAIAFAPPLLKRITIPEWLVQYPDVIGVLGGLAWWLWLQPSIIGWLIVALSLLSAWRSSRATQKIVGGTRR